MSQNTTEQNDSKREGLNEGYIPSTGTNDSGPGKKR